MLHVALYGEVGQSVGYVCPESSRGKFGAIVTAFGNGRIWEDQRWVEGDLFHCKLKCRGCDPDTATADGNADRNFTRFMLFSEKELQNPTFEKFGVVTAESNEITVFFKELK